MVDEAHRLKDSGSLLYQVSALFFFLCHHPLLLTFELFFLVCVCVGVEGIPNWESDADHRHPAAEQPH